MTARRLVAGLALVALVAGMRPARAAGDTDREARALYAEGQRLYRAGAYDEAIAKLEASYRLVPAPGLLYDMAQVHRLKGDCAGARDRYRAYLAHPVNEEVAAMARGHLAEMEACVAPATPAPPTSAALSPPPAAVTPSQLAVPVVVGHPSLPAVPRRSRFWGRRPVVALTATAVVLAATAVTFGWRAAASGDDVSGTFRPGQTWDATGMDAESRGHTSERLELAAAVAALVSGGIAAWLAARD